MLVKLIWPRHVELCKGHQHPEVELWRNSSDSKEGKTAEASDHDQGASFDQLVEEFTQLKQGVRELLQPLRSTAVSNHFNIRRTKARGE